MKAISFWRALLIPVSVAQYIYCDSIYHIVCGRCIVTRCIRFVYPPLLQGVIEFAVALFFSKLVSYAFLFWLPFYIKNTSELPQVIWSCMCIHLHTRIMFFSLLLLLIPVLHSHSTGIGPHCLNTFQSGALATMFDVGAMIGWLRYQYTYMVVWSTITLKCTYKHMPTMWIAFMYIHVSNCVFTISHENKSWG